MRSKGPSRKKNRPDRRELREEALRPSPYLGYDRDEIGRYLMEREAWDLAEAQFRRAVWLNPYEPVFKADLARCLICQGKMEEALKLIAEALESRPGDEGIARLKKIAEDGISAGKAGEKKS